MSHRDILHCDINNFYASVEILLNPELLGHPVAVCGDPEKRHGIVLAKSNLAKLNGVKTGDAVWEAERKCPGLIVVPPNFKEYVKYSREVYDVYTTYTDLVESFGMDECWLDVKGCKRLFGSPEEIAYSIKDNVRKKTGLTISVGVSFTKVFAKLGSDLKKPDAVSVISEENYKKVAWKLNAEEMIFVGRSTKSTLNKYGIYTIGDIANANPEFLNRVMGKSGLKLYEYACGTDNEAVLPYTHKHIPVTVGNGTTTSEDIKTLSEATSVIFSLSEMIAFRLRGYNLSASTVSVNMRDKNLFSFSRQARLLSLSNNAYDIGSLAVDIVKRNYDFNSMPPLRTITVGTSNLSDCDGEAMIQQSFFDTDSEKKINLDESIDRLRAKYGYNVLKRGVTVDEIFTCDSREADDEFLPFDKNNKNLYN